MVEGDNMVLNLVVEGMACNHCKTAIMKALSNIKEVNQVNISLETKDVVIEGMQLNRDYIVELLSGLGYKVIN